MSPSASEAGGISAATGAGVGVGAGAGAGPVGSGHRRARELESIRSFSLDSGAVVRGCGTGNVHDRINIRKKTHRAVVGDEPFWTVELATPSLHGPCTTAP